MNVVVVLTVLIVGAGDVDGEGELVGRFVPVRLGVERHETLLPVQEQHVLYAQRGRAVETKPAKRKVRRLRQSNLAVFMC